MRKLKLFLRKIEYTLKDSFDYLINDTLITAGRLVIDILVTAVTLYYAITGVMPVIPQWGWAGIFVFMLIAGTFSLEDLMYLGYDEDGNKIVDEDETEEPEDEEIAPD